MDIEELWDRALKNTEVVRSRVQGLSTFEATAIPYIFLAESSLNSGDTLVRKGQVMVEKPALILPSPQLEGFEFGDTLPFSDDSVLNFLLVRGVRFPSLRYRHEFSSLDVRDGSLQEGIKFYNEQLQKREDVHTGLVVGPEDAWQFSVLILVGGIVIRQAEGDLKRLIDDWKKHRPN